MKCVLTIVLVFGILIVAGCGGAASTTTSAAAATTVSATTTAAPTTSTTLRTTTTAAAPTTTTLSENARVRQYTAAMGAWVEAFGMWTGTLVVTPDDVTKLTDADVQADRAALAQLHTLADQLHAIQPPVAVAAAHQKAVDAFDAFATLSDKEVAAEASRDQAAYDAANAEAEKARTAFVTAFYELQAAL